MERSDGGDDEEDGNLGMKRTRLHGETKWKGNGSRD